MKPTPRFASLVAGLLLAALAGCKADTITEPRQPPAGPTPPVPPGAAFTVTVTVNPPTLAVGSTSPATVTVDVVGSDGTRPSGTTVTLTTTLGSFGSVGGPQEVTLTLANGTAQTVLFAGSVVGVASVRANFGGVVGLASVSIGETAFFLSHVQPNQGSAAGGDTVTIVGSGFEGPATVTIGGSPAQVLSVGPTQIRVKTPPFGSDPGPTGTPVGISVTIRAGASNAATASLGNAFLYTRGGVGGSIPSIASVTPVTGPNDGGTVVTINGSGFEAPVQVFFELPGTSVEAAVQSVSSTRIVVIAPAATGFGSALRDREVNIRVRNLTNGLEAVAANAFRYGVVIKVTSISPNQGPATGGTMVTIFGEGFDEPVAVSFGSTAQQVVSVSGTQIIVRTAAVLATGCGAVGGGAVSVTNIETGATATGPSFTYVVPEPQITRVTPNSGSQNGGTVVTVQGTNFVPPVRVFFGTQAGNVTSASSTSITVTTPPFAGTFQTAVCDDSPGDGQAGTRQLPTAVDVRVENIETGCDDTFTGGFTYIPADQSCIGDEPPPPDPPTASFTGVCNASNLTCNFSDTSTGATSRSWNFGDPASGAANTSTSPTPSHTFSTANQGYLITLTASNAGGSDTETHTVTCGATGCVFTP